MLNSSHFQKNTQIGSKAPEIDRIICIIVMMAILLLGSASVNGQISDPLYLLSFKAGLELISILVLLKSTNSSVGNDLINFSFLCLLEKVLLILAFIFSKNIYGYIYDLPSILFNSTVFVLTLIRILYVQRIGDEYKWANWKKFDLFPFKKKSTCDPMAVGWFYQIVTMIVSFEMAVILLSVQFGWWNFAPAVAALVLVTTYGEKFRKTIHGLHEQVEEHTLTIDSHKEVILRAAEAIEILERNQRLLEKQAAIQEDQCSGSKNTAKLTVIK